ncbi:MAG: hypothetical protein QNJ20_17380 [Paracoccaceae bacterium]|nr:hypothetical protein [Paracoccaceae bacterium]
MDLTLVNDAARATHLLGLALGFGVAIIADLCAARSLFRPLSRHEFEDLQRYHRTVGLGLAIFWLSGLILLWLRTGFVVAEFSPKLMVKLGVVSLLTVNAILIGRIGLPTMMEWAGCRFGALPLAHRLRLAALAGMSGAGWISALALGAFSAMKTFDWDMLSGIIGTIYFVGLGGALLTATFAPVLSFALDRARGLRSF